MRSTCRNSGSVMSCSCSENEWFPSRWATFLFMPVWKLSTQITSCPSRRRRSHRCDPRNPAPPVTSTRWLSAMSCWFRPGLDRAEAGRQFYRRTGAENIELARLDCRASGAFAVPSARPHASWVGLRRLARSPDRWIRLRAWARIPAGVRSPHVRASIGALRVAALRQDGPKRPSAALAAARFRAMRLRASAGTRRCRTSVRRHSKVRVPRGARASAFPWRLRACRATARRAPTAATRPSSRRST